jgi:hypothetical protein
MQIYLFAPLLLLPFTFNGTLGVLVSLTLFVLSTVANFVTVIITHFPATKFPGWKDPKMTIAPENYDLLMYFAVWVRVQSYLMGFLVGYFLHRRPKLKINRVSLISI